MAWGLRIGAVGLAITLPLALWDVGAFLRSVVTLQLSQPFRADALSYLAYFAKSAVDHPPTVLAFAAAASAWGIALPKASRSPSGFAAALALVFLAFFAFNKQAFCNYYYFVIGAVACALGASQEELQER
jgi:hypothetical protein